MTKEEFLKWLQTCPNLGIRAAIYALVMSAAWDDRLAEQYGTFTEDALFALRDQFINPDFQENQS